MPARVAMCNGRGRCDVRCFEPLDRLLAWLLLCLWVKLARKTKWVCEMLARRGVPTPETLVELSPVFDIPSLSAVRIQWMQYGDARR